jgi:hypothetical protein
MINREAELLLQGHQIELSKITLAIAELKEAIKSKSKYEDLPAWINIDLAVQLKGGCSLGQIKNVFCLQPCCGTNSKLIGGRKCWKTDDVIEWLGIADSDLKRYGEKWKIKIPEKFLERSA